MEQLEASASDRTQRRITTTLALAMLLASLGTSIANIALPAFAAAFFAPFAQVQGVVVAYLAGLTISVTIAGRLGDIYGLKPMLLAGLSLFAIASLVCGVAPNLWLLIGARAIQGAGAAFLMTLSMALIRETASKKHLGRAMGMLGTVSALGTALGPSLGGILLPTTGWPGIFWVQVPAAILTLILAIAVLPDGLGKGRTPLASLWGVLNRNLLPNLLINLLVATVMMTTLVVGPFYLSFGLGLKETLVGLAMSVGPVISIISGVPSGWLVDAWGTRWVLMIGLAMLAVGALLLATVPNMIGVTGYVLAIAILTPGYQLFQAANNTTSLADVPADRRGTVSGLLGLSRNTGMIVGASIMSAVFSFGAATDDFLHVAPAAIADGMRLTFLLAGGMMIVAIYVTAFVRHPEQTLPLAVKRRSLRKS